MEERIPDGRIRIKPAGGAQKNSMNLYLYRAEQFRGCWRVGKRNMQPAPPVLADGEWWRRHYRLQLDRKWLGPKTVKYTFFTLEEVGMIVARLLAGEEI